MAPGLVAPGLVATGPMASTVPSPVTHLLYLHGFRSSPRSFKAERLKAWLAANRPQVHWWCPQLPPSPREAAALVLEGTAGWPAGSAVVGSSLGGFYATVVAESPGRQAWRAVVINPAVDPARDLAAHIGEQTAFHTPDERFFFRAEFIAELCALAPGPLTHRSRYLPIVATGDEVLSCQEMQARYAGEPLRVVPGSDHALSDFDEHLPALLQHLGLGG
jgi:predicted esterase YcpF (UPF0227 family)